MAEFPDKNEKETLYNHVQYCFNYHRLKHSERAKRFHYLRVILPENKALDTIPRRILLRH